MMIACKSLFRIERVVANTHSYLRLKSFCQVCCLQNNLNFMSVNNRTRSKQEFMEQKRKGKISAVWRPLSTQASSAKEDEAPTRYVDLASGPVPSGEFSGNEVKGASESGSVPSDNKASISFKVGASLMRFVKGKWGSTQQKIEEELGVKIIFPSSRNEDHIVIEGSSADSITKASERIQKIVDEAVNSPSLDYSHFISLPLAIHPELVEKLLNFQISILETNNPLKDEYHPSGSKGDTLDDKDEGSVAVKLKDANDKDEGSVAVKLKDANDKDEGSVAVKLKDADDNDEGSVVVQLKDVNDKEQVKVEVNKIQRVSYAPKIRDPSEQKVSKPFAMSDSGIEKSIFIKPATFHLTVLMLKLWNKDRLAAATEVLQSVASKVNEALDNRPVSVRLKGLETMKGSLAKARVIYAPVEEIGSEGRLERACQIIIDAFVEAGLVLEKDAKSTLKLHATVMNVRHRKRNQKKTKYGYGDSFDARDIFKKYGSEEWGEYLIPEAHLLQRFVFDEYGYYHRCSSIAFPKE